MSSVPPLQRVAVALFEGFTVLDVYGPVQAFASCGSCSRMASDAHCSRSSRWRARSARCRQARGPRPGPSGASTRRPTNDILLVPGGFGSRAAVEDQAFLGRLAAASRGRASRRRSARARRCSPARAPRRAARDVEQDRLGLGDPAGAARPLEAQGALGRRRQRADLVRRVAGIDMALSLIARLHGREMALTSARNME